MPGFSRHNYISVTLCTRPTCLIWISDLFTDLVNRIQCMLKRLFKYCYTARLISFRDLINSCSVDLFQCVKRSNRCLYPCAAVLLRIMFRKAIRLRGQNYILVYQHALIACKNSVSLIEFCLFLFDVCDSVYYVYSLSVVQLLRLLQRRRHGFEGGDNFATEAMGKKFWAHVFAYLGADMKQTISLFLRRDSVILHAIIHPSVRPSVCHTGGSVKTVETI